MASGQGGGHFGLAYPGLPATPPPSPGITPSLACALAAGEGWPAAREGGTSATLSQPFRLHPYPHRTTPASTVSTYSPASPSTRLIFPRISTTVPLGIRPPSI